MQIRFPWETEPAAPRPAPAARVPRPRGRRPADLRPPEVAPHWLAHHLTIEGDAAGVLAFAAAARGAGVIPWRLDFDIVEEDVFHMAVAQPAGLRGLSVAGCRILARQFRERAEARHARAAARVGHSLACPFDLHALLPVPPDILQLGPAHPQALAWLQDHWGIMDGLRHVAQEPAEPGALRYRFFTQDTRPETAIVALAGEWPMLRLVLRQVG